MATGSFEPALGNLCEEMAFALVFFIEPWVDMAALPEDCTTIGRQEIYSPGMSPWSRGAFLEDGVILC
jgi:hypothetical protein